MGSTYQYNCDCSLNFSPGGILSLSDSSRVLESYEGTHAEFYGKCGGDPTHPGEKQDR